MRLVYLDTETTGLDFMRHDVVEVAWAVDDDNVLSVVLPHTLENADPEALRINGYWSRALNEKVMSHRTVADLLLQNLTGATIVGSNPAFDVAFLRRKLGYAPWKHRLIDVACYAAGVFGWAEPKGLAALVEHLRKLNYYIPDPDHTAAQDVRVTREVYSALRDVAVTT